MTLPSLLTHPQFYVAGIPAVIFLGMAKGGFAGSFGAFGVPLLSLTMPPVQAAAIILPLLCVIDWWGVGIYWRQWDRDILKIIVPGSLVGIVIGALLFGSLSDNAVRIIVGTIAIVFTLNTWLGLSPREATPVRSRAKGGFWSTVSGVTSFMAHAGGPPLMVYLLPLRLPRATFVATVSFFFLIANAVKLLPYAWLGQFSADNLLASLVLVPFVPLGVHLGRWLQERVNHQVFYRIAEIALFASGIQLIYQSVFSGVF